jgi:hypothetical protein
LRTPVCAPAVEDDPKLNHQSDDARLVNGHVAVGVLVNIAGTGHLDRVVDLLLETWGHTLATDLDGRSSAPSTRPY